MAHTGLLDNGFDTPRGRNAHTGLNTHTTTAAPSSRLPKQHGSAQSTWKYGCSDSDGTWVHRARKEART